MVKSPMPHTLLSQVRFIIYSLQGTSLTAVQFIFGALLMSLTLNPAQSALAQTNTPATQAFHGTLGNGLEVVVVPDRRAPVVTHMVWYRVGGADEPQAKSGIAHFLEHLMFKG